MASVLSTKAKTKRYRSLSFKHLEMSRLCRSNPAQDIPEYLTTTDEGHRAKRCIPFLRLWCVVEIAAAVNFGVPVIIKGGTTQLASATTNNPITDAGAFGKERKNKSLKGSLSLSEIGSAHSSMEASPSSPKYFDHFNMSLDIVETQNGVYDFVRASALGSSVGGGAEEVRVTASDFTVNEIKYWSAQYWRAQKVGAPTLMQLNSYASAFAPKSLLQSTSL